MEPSSWSSTVRKRIILHVDMDAFFAAVEVREHPELSGRPLVVGADPKGGKGRGVVSTASYEARIFGVHSAMPISRAYERCPECIFLRPHFDLYVRASSQVMEIARGFADRVEQVSIDEAYLDISSAGSFSEARKKAASLKDSIRQKTGLTCSVGIGPSKVVAKIASDFRKPDGLTVVDPEHVIEFLSPLPVEKIPGVGKKSRTVLNGLGIRTIGDLGLVDVQELTDLFGRWGAVIHDLSFGIDEREVRQEEGYKSISREVTFDEDTDSPDLLLQTIDLMAEELHATLTEEHLRFRTITIKQRDERFSTHTRSKTLERYSSDLDTIRNTARGLLSNPHTGEKIRLIGLRLSGFEQKGARQTTISEFMTFSSVN